MAHVDNVTELSLADLISRHGNRPRQCILTMVTFETDEPSTCGIVRTNQHGIVEDFYEKIEEPPGNIANGAIYIIEPDIFKYLQRIRVKQPDFSKDILPMLLNKIYTYHTSAPFIDVGTPERLKKASKIWESSQSKK